MGDGVGDGFADGDADGDGEGDADGDGGGTVGAGFEQPKLTASIATSNMTMTNAGNLFTLNLLLYTDI